MGVRKTFRFKLGQSVTLKSGGASGVVAGRAHYTDSLPQYMVRYADAQNTARESWFYDSEIEGGSDEADTE